MRKIKLLSIFVFIVLAVSYYRFAGRNNSDDITALPPSLPNPAGDKNLPKGAANKPRTGTPMVPAIETSTIPQDSNGFLPTKMEDPKRFALIQKNLKDMSVCLNMEMGTLAEDEDFNVATFNRIISPDLGGIVTVTEDWQATDIKTGSGELRRIFLQNQSDAEGNITRTVKYFSVNSGGQQTEIPLSGDQAKNPTETFLAGLESDGQLFSKSIARKYFYQNGDDLSLVERNGQIYYFELAHDKKIMKCSGLDSSKNMSCSCRSLDEN